MHVEHAGFALYATSILLLGLYFLWALDLFNARMFVIDMNFLDVSAAPSIASAIVFLITTFLITYTAYLYAH